MGAVWSIESGEIWKVRVLLSIMNYDVLYCSSGARILVRGGGTSDKISYMNFT